MAEVDHDGDELYLPIRPVPHHTQVAPIIVDDAEHVWQVALYISVESGVFALVLGPQAASDLAGELLEQAILTDRANDLDVARRATDDKR